MVRKVRKGFTLVELLIVIVIIGILAAAMLLASSSATDNAEASNVINDLRSMKTAAMMLYADTKLGSASSAAATTLDLAALAKYMDNPQRITEDNGYMFDATTVTGQWWVGIDLEKTKKATGVRQRLEMRAATIGLFGAKNAGALYVASASEIYMRAILNMQ